MSKVLSFLPVQLIEFSLIPLSSRRTIDNRFYLIIVLSPVELSHCPPFDRSDMAHMTVAIVLWWYLLQFCCFTGLGFKFVRIRNHDSAMCQLLFLANQFKSTETLLAKYTWWNTRFSWNPKAFSLKICWGNTESLWFGWHSLSSRLRPGLQQSC